MTKTTVARERPSAKREVFTTIRHTSEIQMGAAGMAVLLIGLNMLGGQMHNINPATTFLVGHTVATVAILSYSLGRLAGSGKAINLAQHCSLAQGNHSRLFRESAKLAADEVYATGWRLATSAAWAIPTVSGYLFL